MAGDICYNYTALDRSHRHYCLHYYGFRCLYSISTFRDTFGRWSSFTSVSNHTNSQFFPSLPVLLSAVHAFPRSLDILSSDNDFRLDVELIPTMSTFAGGILASIEVICLHSIMQIERVGVLESVKQ